MTKKTFAYGVEPNRTPYCLRLARYQGIGESVDEYSKKKNNILDKIKILDVGGDEGRILRYIEKYPQEKKIICDLVDLFPKGIERVYKKEERELFTANFETDGLKKITDNSYDLIVCEQVLEHLKNPEFLVGEIYRVLKPNGIAIIGVPIFPPLLYRFRKNVIPILDKVIKREKPRSHIQVFTLGSFIKLLKRAGNWKIIEKRGFRIISGGLLRKLEYYEWWWKVNKKIGRIVPFLCIEAQVIVEKTK